MLLMLKSPAQAMPGGAFFVSDGVQVADDLAYGVVR
jgi:hypothetical protein